MLFLPIEKSLLDGVTKNLTSSKQPSRGRPFRANQVKFNHANKTAGTIQLIAPLNKQPHRVHSVARHSKPNAFRDIRKGSEKAVNLIEYMRTVQNAQNAIQANDQKGNTTMHQASKSRVMTTMSPSMKDKLRRDLRTFCREEPILREQQSGVRMMSIGTPSNSIMKLPLPNFTKNAYQDVSVRQKPGSRKGSSLSHTQNILTPMQPIMPSQHLYTKDVNDEVILFRVNAAKPLVSHSRKLSAVARPKSRQQPHKQPYNQVLQHPEYNQGQNVQPRNNTTFKRYRHSQPATLEISSQKKKHTGIKSNALFAKQIEQGTLMSSGKSKHLSAQRNSHEDCKAVYKIAHEEHGTKFTNQSEFQSYCPNSPYGHQDGAAQKEGEVPESPFTVKLCVKCQRSVKFRQKSKSPPAKKRVSSVEVEPVEEILISLRPVLQASQFTQVDGELGNRNRNQRFTQTQATAMDAQTQSEGLGLTHAGTAMSASMEDRQVQTDARKIKRPSTSILRKKKRQELKTFNLMQTGAQEPEMCNGRRFVIFNKDDYDSFVDTKQNHSSFFAALPPNNASFSTNNGAVGARLRYNQ